MRGGVIFYAVLGTKSTTVLQAGEQKTLGFSSSPQLPCSEVRLTGDPMSPSSSQLHPSATFMRPSLRQQVVSEEKSPMKLDMAVLTTSRAACSPL